MCAISCLFLKCSYLCLAEDGESNVSPLVGDTENNEPLQRRLFGKLASTCLPYCVPFESPLKGLKKLQPVTPKLVSG